MRIKTLFFICFYIIVAKSQFAQTEVTADPWDEVSVILDKIVIPSFPDKSFDITCYGAVGDSVTDCTEAFRSAIIECSITGGGKVVVPEGIFLTGQIHLLSNVNLVVTEKAVIKFSTNPNKYLPEVFTRWEGVECMNYSSLIYSYGQENIAVTGTGLLDGQGSNDYWWSWKGNKDDGWKEGMPNQKEAKKNAI